MNGKLPGWVNWRLQNVLVLGFTLTTAITIILGAPITYAVINNYLEEAQDARVGRDMDLADAFYNNKLYDISSTAGRIASASSVQHNLSAASQGDERSSQAVERQIHNEISNLPPGTQRFVVVTDAEGIAVAGLVSSSGTLGPVVPHTDWSLVPIVASALEKGQPLSATEIIPTEELSWIGLEKQAEIRLIDTPKAAQDPFEASEGSAGLVLMGVSPVESDDGKPIGSVLVGHLFNKDYTLVDRIKAVAGVDTATIFFGDLRVSTNVEDEAGKRAIGTRVSQEVFDRVLVRGEEFTGPAYFVNQWYIKRYQPLY